MLSFAGLQKSLVQCVVICRNNYWILLRVHLCYDCGDDGRVTGNDQTSHGSGRTRTARPSNEWLKIRGSIQHQMRSRLIPWMSTSLKCHMKECSHHKSYSWFNSFEWSFFTTSFPLFLVAGCEDGEVTLHWHLSLPETQRRSASTWQHQFNVMCVFSGWKSQTRVWLWLWFRDEVRRIFIFIIQIQPRTQYNYDLIRPNSFYKVLKFVTGGGL